MALAVGSFAQVADWFSTATTKTVAATWSTGDAVVVVGAVESANTTLNTPTVSGLTFTLRASAGVGSGGTESEVYVWTAIAGSNGSGNISVTGNAKWGFGVWVDTGNPSGIGVNFGNLNESTTNMAVAAGSIVHYILGDWNANTTNQTAATGSGTSTERVDIGDGVSYGVCVYDWVGTSAGTIAFGLASYTGVQAAQVAVEILAPAGTPVSDVRGRRNLGLLIR